MRVVLSADGSDEGAAAVAWCRDHLHPGDAVVAVLGVNPAGELAIGVPPFDVVGGEAELLKGIEDTYGAVLRDRGMACEVNIVYHGQGRAVLEAANETHTDLVVIGKRPHGAIADALLGEVANQVIHHPPCPVLVVPTEPTSPQ